MWFNYNELSAVFLLQLHQTTESKLTLATTKSQSCFSSTVSRGKIRDKAPTQPAFVCQLNVVTELTENQDTLWVYLQSFTSPITGFLTQVKIIFSSHYLTISQLVLATLYPCGPIHDMLAEREKSMCRVFPSRLSNTSSMRSADSTLPHWQHMRSVTHSLKWLFKH